MLFLLYNSNLKLFFKKILETFRFLLIIFEINLVKTFNISLKKPKIRYHNFTIFNLFR